MKVRSQWKRGSINQMIATTLRSLGWKYKDIALYLGITRQRAHQLVGRGMVSGWRKI
jgi:hypothetical protein